MIDTEKIHEYLEEIIHLQKKDFLIAKTQLEQLLLEISKPYGHKEHSHIYEQQIGKISDNKTLDTENLLMHILGEYFSSDGSDIEKEQAAFSAYYALHIYYRHQFSSEALKNLEGKYESLFYPSHKIILHLRILTKLNYRNRENPINEDLLQASYENWANFNEHLGVAHAFADIAATIFENKVQEEVDLSKPSESFKCLQSRWYPEAVRALNQIISKEKEYGKFYATKARVISFGEDNSRFDEARALLFKARSLEPINSSNYSIRISQYLLYENQINMREFMYNNLSNSRHILLESLHDIKNQLIEEEANLKQDLTSITEKFNERINETNSKLDQEFSDKIFEMENAFQKIVDKKENSFREKVDNASHKNIEYLALFSAMICIFITIVGSPVPETLSENSSLVAGASAVSTCGLIGVFLGCLLCLLTCFSFFIHIKKGFDKIMPVLLAYIISLLLSLILIIGGVHVLEVVTKLPLLPWSN